MQFPIFKFSSQIRFFFRQIMDENNINISSKGNAFNVHRSMNNIVSQAKVTNDQVLFILQWTLKIPSFLK